MPELIMLDFSHKDPLYMQLYRYFKTEIEHNRLKDGDKLPSIRYLAGNLSVSKVTVEKAYLQLMCEGYIQSCNRSRYSVNKFVEVAFKSAVTPVAKNYEAAEQSPVLYDFVSGEMDSNGFDFALWKRYINMVFSDKTRLVGYCNNAGEDELRGEIVKYVRSRGVCCQRGQIVIGPGIQSLLNTLCSILKSENDSIAFEEPGFKHGRRIWADWGFAIIPIPMKKAGLDTDELVNSGTRLVYLTPSHQFPTGYIMPIGERMRLLQWAKAVGALIIEDDYDSEFRYFGRPIPALKALDNEENVVYIGSFSKVMPPSIRISYMVLPDSLLALYKQNSALYNQAASTMEQLALAKYMADGHLERQIRRLRKIYYEKKLLFIAALNSILGDKVQVNETESGLHIVLTVKTALTSQEIYQKALANGCRVALLQDYYLVEPAESLPQVILYFSKIPSSEMKTAIQRLKEAWF